MTSNILTTALVILFAAEGARRIFVGVRLLTRRSGIPRENLGLGGTGALTGGKAKGLGIFYLVVGLIMILLVVGVRAHRGHW